MTISYAITVCNELEEIQKLLNFLQVRIREEDEIVIQYDDQSVTDEVMEYLTLMEKLHKYTIVGFPLNKDFASFKKSTASIALVPVPQKKITSPFCGIALANAAGFIFSAWILIAPTIVPFLKSSGALTSIRVTDLGNFL